MSLNTIGLKTSSLNHRPVVLVIVFESHKSRVVVNRAMTEQYMCAITYCSALTSTFFNKYVTMQHCTN